MTKTTTNLQLPYPEPGDPVTGGDDAIKALAEALEAGMAPFRMAAGSMSFPASGAVSVINTVVPFTAGRFIVPPLVFCTLNNAPDGSLAAVPRALNTTVNQFNLYIISTTGANFSFATPLGVNWFAIQMTATAAAGG